jgi:MFS family permease
MITRALERDERHMLLLLGLPTGALALGITVVTSFVPVRTDEVFGSSTVIGVLIGIEGIMALWVPLLVGAWSDHLRTSLGGRLPFIAVAAAPLVASLVVLGVVSDGVVIALTLALFFMAYFVAYEPYRALYPDLFPLEIAGRAQSAQALWRGGGTGVALIGGGLLIAVDEALPFALAAAVIALSTLVFVPLAARRLHPHKEVTAVAPVVTVRELFGLVSGDRDLQAFLVANGLWEASLGALKTFVFLFIVEGLDKSPAAAAGIVGGVALTVLVAAPISGRLGDRLGPARVILLVLPFYGAGLLIVAFTQAPPVVVPLLPLVGFGGGLIMTLPYAVMQPLMPDHHHGVLTGFYSLSRGIGTAIGPLLAGLAIQLLSGPFSGTQGYAAMWLVCGGTILLSIPPTRRLVSADRRR